MLTKLTLGEKLKDLRLAKGYKSTEQLASVVNIPKTTLNDYENDEKNQDVGYANLITLAKFYEVSMDYLLGLSDADRHLNTEYMDLGLNDDVIDLLRERKINTRLLCDLILDPSFIDFIADMEIYINGLISMRITALNTQLQATRTLLKRKRNVPEGDINMRTTLLGQFDETRYFRTIIGEDIDKILCSLREKYKENNKDNTVTSSDVNLGEMTVNAVEQYQSLKGSTAEKQVTFLSSFTGAKVEKMSAADKKAHGSFLKALSKFWKKL